MPKKPQAPTMSPRQFDAIAPQLRAALRTWWEDEAQSFDAAIAGTGAVWEGLPEIDSKAVVKASPVIRHFVGVDLDPRLIKRGGYPSFDALADDLLAKLRASCPTSPPSRLGAPARSLETINARRS